jgi:heme-degrading monooxygenase HmoA
MADRYICSATRIRVRGPRQLFGFLRASAVTTLVARRTPGNARTRLLGMPPFLIFHTLTVWESEAAMMNFVSSPQHRVAMAGFEEWTERGRFVRFSSETRRVGWRRAFRALRDPDGSYQRGAGYTRRGVSEAPSEA